MSLYIWGNLLFKGEKSYRAYWILIAAVAVYSLTISFLPWAGYVDIESTIELSSYIVVGFVIFGILFLMVYLRGHLRTSDPVKVRGEQVLPHKFKFLKKPLGPGRKLEAPVDREKMDRWDNKTCKEIFVRDLCETCTHHRRRYYGNFCKHFGYVVDRPSHAA
jgi:hypothetical protein